MFTCVIYKAIEILSKYSKNDFLRIYSINIFPLLLVKPVINVNYRNGIQHVNATLT